MSEEETLNGYTFELVDNGFYQCKGDVCYDNEHDEAPEEGLWEAALKLEQKLNNQGLEAETNYSEKGWVEVVILY